MSGLEVTMMNRIGELKRYTGKTEGSLLGSPHWEHPEGEWVKWEDYASLKAEVERLRASSFVTAVPSEHYERVIKAGDAMVQLLCHMDVVMDMDSDHPEVEAWNAAKEGRPNE